MSKHDTLQIIKKFITDYTSTTAYFKESILYKGNLTLGGTSYNILGAFFEENPHSIANKALECYEGDIIFLINIKHNVVLMRKKESCNVDLGKLAKQLSTGGGTASVAGCVLNETIINITKLLQPC